MARGTTYYTLDVAEAEKATAMIASELGTEFGKDSQLHRVDALLADFLPGLDVERQLLKVAYTIGAVRDLKSVSRGNEISPLIESLLEQMRKRYFTEQGCQFAIKCWVTALNLQMPPLANGKVLSKKATPQVQLPPLVIAKVLSKKATPQQQMPPKRAATNLKQRKPRVPVSRVALFVLLPLLAIAVMIFTMVILRARYNPSVSKENATDSKKSISSTPSITMPQQSNTPENQQEIEHNSDFNSDETHKTTIAQEEFVPNLQQPDIAESENKPNVDNSIATPHDVKASKINTPTFWVAQLNATFSSAGRVKFEAPTHAQYLLSDMPSPEHVFAVDDAPTDPKFTLSHDERSCHMINRTDKAYKFSWFYRYNDWWLVDGFIVDIEKAKFYRYVFAYDETRSSWWVIQGSALLNMKPTFQADCLDPVSLKKRSVLKEIALAFYDPKWAIGIVEYLSRRKQTEQN